MSYTSAECQCISGGLFKYLKDTRKPVCLSSKSCHQKPIPSYSTGRGLSRKGYKAIKRARPSCATSKRIIIGRNRYRRCHRCRWRTPASPPIRRASRLQPLRQEPMLGRPSFWQYSTLFRCFSLSKRLKWHLWLTSSLT